MTNTDTLRWIKTNLSPIIQQAIASRKANNPSLIYTEDWLAAICCRETGELIAKRLLAAGNVPSGQILAAISPLMRGDFSQRPGETEASYHGYGFTQIDIASFPAFVSSGKWKDALQCFLMSIAILETDRVFLSQHFPDLGPDSLARAVTAAYNCGAGNVRQVLNEQHDIDIRTTGKNYSAQVWEFRAIYVTL
jgi:hypothetical protein